MQRELGDFSCLVNAKETRGKSGKQTEKIYFNLAKVGVEGSNCFDRSNKVSKIIKDHRRGDASRPSPGGAQAAGSSVMRMGKRRATSARSRGIRT